LIRPAPDATMRTEKTGRSYRASAVKASLRHIFRGLIPQVAHTMIFSLRHRLRVRRAERTVARFSSPVSRPHGLPGELVVSLTSYPPRFPTLAKTVKSLLMQTVKPDRTVLWISSADRDELPDDILNLQDHGLEIRTCEDLRSFKKAIPSLETFPDAFLVTADDDLYYERNWLETIVSGFVPEERVIVCRRAHRPLASSDGFAPYISWEHDISNDSIIEESIFPTSGAGALYPPGSLAPEVTDKALFEELCPDADDVWLFVMALRAGSHFRRVGGGFVQVSWDGSQKETLMSTNLSGGNDRQLAAVLKHFGAVDRTRFDGTD